MFGYINSTTDRELKLCTQADFERMINSPFVKSCIEEYRKGSETKKLLPAFVFQGIHPNCVLGKIGKRTATTLIPTGLFIMDFDHVEDPMQTYDLFLQKMGALGFTWEKDIALIHVTPSGKGLRLVIKLPEGMAIDKAQIRTAEAMGIKCDTCVKDLSRLSYCPQTSDIIYINKKLLFANNVKINENENSINHLEGNLFGGNPETAEDTARSNVNSSVPELLRPEDADGCSGRTCENGASAEGIDKSDGESDGMLRTPASHNFPTHYKGIPYKAIVEELIAINGGQPQVGNRENTLFLIASDLAKITDRSPLWLESILPTFGLPENEWRATIQQVCKKPLETGLSRKLRQAIDRCKAFVQPENESSVTESSLPPALPAKIPALVEHLTSRVPEHLRQPLASMCFPSLAAHINNAKFLTASGEEIELGMACVLLAVQSSGKSCVKKPIKWIMDDIDRADNISLERLRIWREKRKTRKASEKGEPKPRVVVRYLPEDITAPAFVERLGCAEDADPEKLNQCLYTHCDEIEKLYNFAARSGKAEIRQVLKSAFDRDRVGQFRATEEAINEKTYLRLNWTACSTIQNGLDFFSGKMITDGAVSRIDFCTIITPPDYDESQYRILPYDKEWRDKLQPYIENLNNFRCKFDEDGEIVPMYIPEIIALDRYFDVIIKERNDEAAEDDLYRDYGRRTKTFTLKRMITLYIANGCQWDDCFNDYAKYLFEYSMWGKLAFFYDKAHEAFKNEKIKLVGHHSPLKMMKRVFTFEEFEAECRKPEYACITPTKMMLSTYRYRGLITQEKDKYVLSDKFCKKYNIV